MLFGFWSSRLCSRLWPDSLVLLAGVLVDERFVQGDPKAVFELIGWRLGSQLRELLVGFARFDFGLHEFDTGFPAPEAV